MRKKLVIGFTGHRPNKLKNGYDIKGNVSKAIAEAIEANVLNVIADHPAEQVVFLTGGAIGTDQIAFWVGEKLKRNGVKLQNIVCVPCPNQDSRWTDENKTWYQRMISRADRVINVWEIDAYKADTVYEQMQKRNEYMANYSNIMVAVFNNLRKGGTWNCVEYCNTIQLPVLQINPLEILKGLPVE